MKKYLLFRLYGPMCSWGDIAVGETRPSFSHPTKSAVLGLVAGALGIRRDEEEKHRLLGEALGFAVLVESVGTPLTDYHTAQVPSGNERYYTRKDELAGPRSDLNTILSSRDYRSDGLYTVALWEKEQNEWGLKRMVDALKQPFFVPYLGRKSCPSAVPFEPQMIDAATLIESFARARFLDFNGMGLKTTGQKALYWDKCDHAGINEQHVFERRDMLLSRGRWQFDTRQEMHAAL